MQLRKCDLAKAEAQDRPWQLVSDLQAAAKHVSAWPIIRVSLNLEPESDEPAEIRGTVVIKVVLCLHSTRQIIVFKLHASHDGQIVNGGAPDFVLSLYVKLSSSKDLHIKLMYV